MALITWSDKYSVKVKSIDLQHKKLVELINELHEALAAAKAKEVLSKILQDLINYTKDHFSYEEQLLNKNNYPALFGHKQEHTNLTNKVVDFQNQFLAGRTSISIEMMNFLRDWLVNHINGTDKKYSEFLASKGVN